MFPIICKIQERKKKTIKQKGFIGGRWSRVYVIKVFVYMCTSVFLKAIIVH